MQNAISSLVTTH